MKELYERLCDLADMPKYKFFYKNELNDTFKKLAKELVENYYCALQGYETIKNWENAK